MKNFITWQKREPRKLQLTWLTAQRQRAKEVQAEKERRTRELQANYLHLTERAAALALQAQLQAAQLYAQPIGSVSNKRLASKYSKAASTMTNRTIEVQIRKPSTKECSGQFTRTENTGHIQLDPQLDAESAVSTFLHEVSHAALHWDSIVASKLHLRSPRTVNCTGKSPNRPANYDAEEKEADKLRDKMVALLGLYVDPLKPNYENRALDWLILDSS